MYAGGEVSVYPIVLKKTKRKLVGWHKIKTYYILFLVSLDHFVRVILIASINIKMLKRPLEAFIFRAFNFVIRLALKFR